MSNTTVTIVFIPDITEVFVAENGSNYCKIVTEELFQRHDDYSRDISVVPGVSRIKFVAVPDGVEHYYWKYSDDHSNDGTQIGEGVEVKKIFWSDGYCACSIGEVSSATIQKYIESQG